MKTKDSAQQGARTPIRVLFFDHTAARSGGEIALLNLVRHLDRLAVKPTVVFGADGPIAEEMRHVADTHVLPLSTAVGRTKKDSLGVSSLLRIRTVLTCAMYVGRLARFIRKNQVDVIHTNSLKADVLGGFAGRLAGRPVIWHVRDRIDDDYLPRPVVRIFRILARLLPRFVIANSDATLRTLHPSAWWSGTAIASGVDLGRRSSVVHDGTPSFARENGASGHGEEFRIGLIGRICPWKGQHIFLRAAAIVRKRFPNARFFIVGSALFGEAQYEEEVRLLAKNLEMTDSVTFTGFRSDVHNVIAEMNLIVHASTTGEPFGQVIIEGMAAGKPVIATNGGGVPEIVEDGKTGILVPMADAEAMAEAICRVLADPAVAAEMGARGRERVHRHFTIDQTARKVEAVYEEVLRL